MWLRGEEPFACHAPLCPEPHRGPAVFLPHREAGSFCGRKARSDRRPRCSGARPLPGRCLPSAPGSGAQPAACFAGPLVGPPTAPAQTGACPHGGRARTWGSAAGMGLVPGGCGLHLPCRSPGPPLLPLGHRAPAGALQGRVHGSLASRGPCDFTPVSLLSSHAMGFTEKPKKELSPEEMPQISKFTPWQR